MTILAGVLGDPVGHSRSPAMHNAAYRELGMDWFYVAIEVPAERFKERVLELPEQGFIGANVTIPHKLAALELADRASEAAAAIGAANMLTFKDGEVEADNTDAAAMLELLSSAGLGDAAGLNALVLGAGGAARAVVWALIEAGVGELRVWNRSPERAAELVEELADGPALTAVAEPAAAASDADLIVNATSIGMSGAPYGSGEAAGELRQLGLSETDLNAGQLLVDLTYRPGGTELVRVARECGLTCVDGLDFLVQQGAASFSQWCGREAPIETMRAAARISS